METLIPILIALVGGPCSGKSLILRALQEQFSGQLLVVSELADSFLKGGVFPVPGRDFEEDISRWQRCFQNAIYPSQVAAQEAWLIAATEKGIPIVICDRGTLDGAAYWEGGVSAFCEYFRTELGVEYARYETVICLETLAVHDPQLFLRLRGSNSNRFETLEETLVLDERVRGVWKDHPDFNRVEARGDFPAKMAAVNAVIRRFL